jgi:hypothetical protein
MNVGELSLPIPPDLAELAKGAEIGGPERILHRPIESGKDVLFPSPSIQFDESFDLLHPRNHLRIGSGAISRGFGVEVGMEGAMDFGPFPGEVL